MKSNVSKKKEAKKGGRNKSLIEQPLLLNEIDKKLEIAQKETSACRPSQKRYTAMDLSTG